MKKNKRWKSQAYLDHTLSGLDAMETRSRFIYVQWELIGGWIRTKVGCGDDA